MQSFHLEPSKEARYKSFLLSVLARVKESRASDLHLTAGASPVLRISGLLASVGEEDIITEIFLEDLLDVMLTKDQRERLDRSKNLIFTKNFDNDLRFKVKIFFQKGAPAISFRFIPEVNFSIDALGLPAQIKIIVEEPHGIFLITGPFDSGKSTALAAIMNYVNDTARKHIVTIEDPIEHIIANNKSIVEQREIGIDATNAVAGLKFLNEEDVDVIVLGNLEGRHLAEQALAASSSGRMLIAVMGTNYSTDCLEKIYGYFPQEEQTWARAILSENLLAILNQRLVPKIGGGRALAYEFITNTPAVKNLISEGAFYRLPRLLEATNDAGIIPLERSLAILVRKGIVRLEDALHESQNHALLEHLVRT